MAVITCKHCGKYISSTLKSCPECGKSLAEDIVDEQGAPEENQEQLAEDSMPQTTREGEDDAREEAAAPVQVRKSKMPFRKRYTKKFGELVKIPEGHVPSALGLTWLRRISIRRVLLSGSIALALLGVSFFVYKDYQRTASLEQRAFDRLKGCSNLEFYEDYIVRFPDGKHIEDVKKLYQQIKNESNQFYAKTAHGTREELVSFINTYPQSPYCQVCMNRLDSLDWQEATSGNTVKDYEHYLELHPEGQFADIANESRTRLARLEVTDEEVNKIHGILDTFLSALASNDAARIDGIIGQAISFCGTSDARGQQIISLYKDHFSYPDILGVHFSIKNGPNVKKRPSVTYSGQYDYTVAAVLEATLNRTATDSVNVQYWNLSVQLNPERKLTSIDMRKQ